MRVVLDTNVVIAAFASRGLCAEIFEVCLLEHTIITSEHILSEIQEKLSKKIHIQKNIAHNIIAYLKDIAEIVEPALVDESICREKDDNMVIGAAVSGNARFIITGDNDLLCLKSYKDIEIISPREFWHFLRHESK
jgi:putative PIN family toxin of toxin-antitoxin system